MYFMHITYSRYYPDGAQTQPAETYQVRRIATALKCKMRPQDFTLVALLAGPTHWETTYNPFVMCKGRIVNFTINPLSTGIV